MIWSGLLRRASLSLSTDGLSSLIRAGSAWRDMNRRQPCPAALGPVSDLLPCPLPSQVSPVRPLYFIGPVLQTECPNPSQLLRFSKDHQLVVPRNAHLALYFAAQSFEGKHGLEIRLPWVPITALSFSSFVIPASERL